MWAAADMISLDKLSGVVPPQIKQSYSIKILFELKSQSVWYLMRIKNTTKI